MKQDRVFLSYAREDVNSAQRLYRALSSAGVDVWIDEEHLPPGARWKEHIFKTIRSSRYFVAILSSNSVSKRGFVQAEIREGLEVLAEHPEDEVYIIPVRLDPCEPSHSALSELNWVNMFPEWNNGENKLIRFLTGTTVRYDGIYVCGPDDPSDGTWRILRFFQNGKVSWDFTNENPEAMIEQLANNKQQLNLSDFTISSGKINFTSTSLKGNVDFHGEAMTDRMVLRFHSHINDNRGIFEYEFRKHPVM